MAVRIGEEGLSAKFVVRRGIALRDVAVLAVVHPVLSVGDFEGSRFGDEGA